ncbi:TIGR01906 family membrane protein [Chloroflexota bacterium]
MSAELKQNGERLYRGLSWLVTLLVPVALVLSAMRLIMTPAFLRIEYNMPYFPVDRYGFTTQDRLYWSRFALDYLVNSADISYLGDLKFENGEPIYNQRELGHMIDVKAAMRAALLAWYASLVILLALGIWAWRGAWWQEYRTGLRRGGWMTAIGIGLIVFFVLVSFGVFFVAFHNVFFDAGTWIFKYSDTLIRLFPERFWQDIFIYVGVLSVVIGLVLAFGLRERRL